MDFGVGAMQSHLVVKVKHGDTLRRFNAHVNESEQLDLEMVGLRAKIIGLFNFPPDAELTLTYIDEDGDVVTLVDDDDLHDAVRQRLKFLRIDVQLNSDRIPKSVRSSGNSTPLRSPSAQCPLPNINVGVVELLKSVPEPVRDVISKLSVELASVAASSSPVVAELVEGFSKIGQSYSNAVSQPQVGACAGKQSRSSEVPDNSVNPSKPLEESQPKSATLDSDCKASDKKDIPKATRVSETPVHTDPAGFNWKQMGVYTDSVDSQSAAWNSSRTASIFFPGSIKNNTNQTDGYQKGKLVNLDESTSFDDRARKYSITSVSPYLNGNPLSECPFGGTPIADGPLFHRAPFPFGRRRNCGTPDGIFSNVHKGIQCDGCGAFPITGPRFKSKVKENYDLCNICFSKMGNDTDYMRMDIPAPQFQRFPWCHKASTDKVARFGAPFNAGPSFRRARPSWSKLDSRFILDVNVLDGTVMAPSTPFIKIWRMRNNGNLPWPRGVQLMWVGGDKFSDLASVEVEVPLEGVPVEGELDIAVDFTAPELPGRYISYWRLASPSGVKFGQRVWVLIQVDASLKDSTSDGLEGFNLNLPPTSSGIRDAEVIDMNADPIVERCNPDVVVEPLKSMVDGQSKKEQELNFAAIDGHLAGNNLQASAPPKAQSSTSTFSPSSSLAHPIVNEGVGYFPEVPSSSTMLYPEFPSSSSKLYPEVPSSSSKLYPEVPSSSSKLYPEVPFSSTVTYPEAPSSSNVLYPIIDLSETAPAAPSTLPSISVISAPASGQGISDGSDVEQSLLNELEAMGFKQLDLNKEILRVNEYDLEKSVDDLCGVTGWDPILEELQEMGFRDAEMNKKLLKKNNGSIKGVVMDLLTGEEN